MDSSLLLQPHVSWLVTSPFAVSHSGPFLSLPSTTQQVDRSSVPLARPLLNPSKCLPFKVSITDTTSFASSHSISSGFFSPNPITYGTVCTAQPVLSCTMLDMTSVCPLSAQWLPTAVLWFVRKEAKNEFVASKFSKRALPNKPNCNGKKRRLMNGRDRL